MVMKFTDMAEHLLSAHQHARSTDPDTSHEAVPKNITAQALLVLKSYRPGRPLTDHEAYLLAGFGEGRLTHQRCSDLRDREFIKWIDTRGTTPSGNSCKMSKITDAGLQYLIEKEKK